MTSKDSTYTEFELQKENGVLDRLEKESRSYTYSFWPSSAEKQDIELKFFQKPIYNYKLECQGDP